MQNGKISSTGSSKALSNAISIDVEEYFQVTGFEKVVGRNTWDVFESRLDVGMTDILATLARNQTKATFFFLGWIVERHPDCLRKVVDQGHEVAVHGYDHKLIYDQTPAAFRDDLEKTLEIIHRIYDGPVLGYRAPSFSIREDTRWALDIIRDLGFRYDSSIFPFKRERYGIAGSPTTPYEVLPGLMEFPMSTVTVRGKVIPVCGGGYFRLYPYSLTRRAIQHLNAEGQPALVYMHPWEFDPQQPKVKADIGNSFRHRVNLARTPKRFDKLCSEFDFKPIREILNL